MDDTPDSRFYQHLSEVEEKAEESVAQSAEVNTATGE